MHSEPPPRCQWSAWDSCSDQCRGIEIRQCTCQSVSLLRSCIPGSTESRECSTNSPICFIYSPIFIALIAGMSAIVVIAMCVALARYRSARRLNSASSSSSAAAAASRADSGVIRRIAFPYSTRSGEMNEAYQTDRPPDYRECVLNHSQQYPATNSTADMAATLPSCHHHHYRDRSLSQQDLPPEYEEAVAQIKRQALANATAVAIETGDAIMIGESDAAAAAAAGESTAVNDNTILNNPDIIEKPETNDQNPDANDTTSHDTTTTVSSEMRPN